MCTYVWCTMFLQMYLCEYHCELNGAVCMTIHIRECECVGVFVHRCVGALVHIVNRYSMDVQ